MSVINKMLRDLDARNQPASDSALPRSVPPPVVSIPKTPSRSGSGSAGKRALLVAVVGAAVWWWARGGGPSVSLPAQPPQVPAVAAASSALAPEAAPEQQATPAARAASSSKSRTKAVVPPPKVSAGAKPVPPQGKAVAQDAGRAVTPSAVPVAGAASHAAPAAAAATVAPAGSADVTAANRQQQGVREALAQAQALWSAGSRDAAIDLLQQALSLLERSGGGSANAPQLAALARELGRMLVAEGRPAAALDTLTRLEPQLAKEADIWALRGNAAQRLGRHQESIQAYATALQLRPNEQRWMLASAVSMAALGQLANAGDMAAKAGALGPISKEVQAYLRQAGVRLGEP